MVLQHNLSFIFSTGDDAINLLKPSSWFCNTQTINFHFDSDIGIDLLNPSSQFCNTQTINFHFDSDIAIDLLKPSSQFCNTQIINFHFDSDIAIDLLKPFLQFRNCQLQTDETLREPPMPSTSHMFFLTLNTMKWFTQKIKILLWL